MAENLSEPTGGLIDAVKSTENIEAARQLTVETEGVTTAMQGMAFQLENIALLQLRGSQSADDLAKALAGIREGASKATDTFDRASKNILAYEYATQRVIQQFASITMGANALTSVLGGVSAALARNHRGLSLTIAGVKTMVDMYDNAIIAHREVAASLLQTGISYRNNSAAIDHNRRSLERAGATWGMLGEEAAKFQQMAAGAGIGARPGGAPGSDRTNRAALELESAFNAAMAASKAYSLSQTETMRMTVNLGTTFDLKGREFFNVLGMLTKQGEMSALGQKRQLDTINILTDSTKSYLPNILAMSVYTSAFSDGLKKGIVSLESIAAMSSPAKMANEHLFLMVSQMQSAGIALDGVKLNTLSLTEASYKYQQWMERVQTDPSKEDKAILQELDPRKWGIARLPGVADMDPMLRHMAMQATGSPFAQTTAVGTQKFLDQPVDKYFDQARTGAGAQKAGEELEKSGKEVFKAFATTKELTAGIAGAFREEVVKGGLQFAAIVTGAAALSVLPRAASGAAALAGGIGTGVAGAAATYGAATTAAGIGVAGAGGYLAGMGIDKLLRKYTGWAGVGGDLAESLGAARAEGVYRPSGIKGDRATGGLIPETGNYRLHAGERVTRAGGSGGGMSISLGGINVNVGERGDLRGQLHNAMTNLEDKIYRKIEEQWAGTALAS